ncbi:flagellar hook-associated protein FlgK [Paraburkholderia phosphatilytica]|uniref:flagellar hook-associated protein FlgK n=1 Tax=Paraburkholderia phosphatilytica TaxID=2282883 RepID=UPI000E547C32|nr:flagellar hook-associated protein FlgK [Paraburkholderia phosphatilytica]
MSDIISIGLSGLAAAQLGLQTSGENISNASTTGYTLETPVYAEASGQYTSSGYVGGGVNTVTVQRAYSQYLTTELNNAQSSSSSMSAAYQLASQLNNLVGSPTSGIASAMTTFFSGLQTVSNDPSNLSTRQTAMSDATALADQINALGQQYDQLRSSVNTQITSTVASINQYSTQIAKLNSEINAASASGQSPNQLLDQRDTAVSNLSQLVGVQVVSNSSGYNVFIGNGQPLVVGSQNFSLSTQASPTDPSELSVAYQGLSSSSSSAQVMSDTAFSGGTLGGIMQFRDQMLDPSEQQLGAIATSFAAQVNSQNALGIDLSGNTGGALFSVGSPTVVASSKNTGTESVTASLVDPTAASSDSYALSYASGTYTLTDTTSNTVVGTATPGTSTSATIGNFNFTLSGTPATGDTFSVQGTRGALDSFAVATSDPSAIAAAAPVLASASSSNTGSATITQGSVTAGYTVPSTATTLTYTASGSTGSLAGFATGSTVTVAVPGSSTSTTYTIGTGTGDVTSIPYDPSTGATITVANSTSGNLNNVSFTISGTPSTNDTFTIGSNTTGTKDGRNALALSNLTSSTSMSGGTTLTGAYANYVDGIGNSTSSLNASNTAQASLVSQITTQQQSVSGVNLDEEASNLLQYQQLYQANSKVIQTAASLFQTLLGIFQ